MIKRWSLALLLVALCGCFKVKDELTLQPDGSGTVRLEVRSSVPAGMLGNMGLGARMGGSGDLVMYPPTSEAEAKKFFPERDFTLTAKEEKAGENETALVITAAFKDVNALLASPYGHAHALSLKVENGALALKALSGLEGPARFAEVKDDTGMMDMGMAGLADLQKKKDEMRAEFRVTLPNAVTGGNGAHEGKTVAWVLERAKLKDAAEFAQEAGKVLEASCAADGLKMSPLTPTRLGLLPFKELAAGPVAEKAAAFDAPKIAAAAKFVPYALQVTRTLDLSGEGGMHQNSAQLFGAVVLPKEFTPQKWGEVKLEEVVDGKGNNLKLAEHDASRFGSQFVRDEQEEDDEDGNKPASAAEDRHMITLSFQPPDWKVKEIARIKGALNLQYYGAAQIVKLTNAVPASWIVDPLKTPNAFDGMGATERSLNDPKLAELGLPIRFTMGMAQSGMTMLMLQPGGKKAALADAQVFDAEGHPWPTTFQSMAFGEEGGCQVVVAGKPHPPLSLALRVSGVGANVEVPILVEHVPVTGK